MNNTLILLISMAPFIVSCTSGDVADTPRYAMRPGMRFEYVVEDRWEDAASSQSLSKHHVTMWVQEVNADGAHKLLVRRVARTSGKEDVEFGRITVYEHGDFVVDMPQELVNRLRWHLPVVPCGNGADIEATQSAPFYKDVRIQGGRRRGCFRRRPTYAFEAEINAAHFDMVARGDVVWNERAGAPGTITMIREHMEESERQGRHIFTARLASARTAPGSERNSFLPDLDRFLQARDTYLRSMEKSMRVLDKEALARWEEEYDGKIAPLQAAWRDLPRSEFRKHLESMMDAHRGGMRTTRVEHLRAALDFRNQPAPKWELPDFDGATHRLEDYLGKVVLLYFWLGWAPSCEPVMPVIIGMADRFAGQPFALLGMNVDDPRQLSRTRKILDRWGSGLLSLQARDVRDAYLARGLQSFVLIDAEGVVRLHESGFDDDTKDILIEAIEKALSNAGEFS